MLIVSGDIFYQTDMSGLHDGRRSFHPWG
ncbi:uncharacterized protein METZ01_LOCUS17559 [marine metagenome]|uniref:Uncharacterized protein n=1 Tax=marine metagenome TaxID=408172 RepID=A0A381PCJ6_9ZZZZ